MPNEQLPEGYVDERVCRGKPRAQRGVHLALTVLVVVLLAVTGCATAAQRQARAVDPEQVAAEIIPLDGASTSYGIPLSLKNTQFFVDYYKAATLTAAQEQVLHSALVPLKAPCCDENSIDIC